MAGGRPVPPAGIWDQDQGSKRPGWVHLAAFLVLIVGGIIFGSFSSLSFKVTNNLSPSSPAYGVNYFWLGIVVQQAGSIWFGAWGVAAGVLFPLISNTVTSASILVSLTYIPANFIQSFLPAYAVRKLKLNPGL